jgi:hypothetical protein
LLLLAQLVTSLTPIFLFIGAGLGVPGSSEVDRSSDIRWYGALGPQTPLCTRKRLFFGIGWFSNPEAFNWRQCCRMALRLSGSCRYELAIRRSILYRCGLFSLRHHYNCCLADLWQRPGTTNGENRFAYFECCLVSLIACFCSQIYASHTLSISRTQMSALGLCSGCTKGSGGQVDARRPTSIERRCMQVVCWQ